MAVAPAVTVCVDDASVSLSVRLRTGDAPVPDSPTVFAPATLLATFSVAVLAPAAAGLKVTVMVQVPVVAGIPPTAPTQLSVSE